MDKADIESISDRYLDSLYYIAINYIDLSIANPFSGIYICIRVV